MAGSRPRSCAAAAATRYWDWVPAVPRLPVVADIRRRLPGPMIAVLPGILRRWLSARSGGLFGVPGLADPSGFARVADDAIGRCQTLVGMLRRHALPSQSLSIIDQISVECCRAADVAELCRHVHPNPSWRAAAQAAHDRMCRYLAQLNTNVAIYDILLSCARSPLASREERRLAQSLLQDMAETGIGLDADRGAQLRRLGRRIDDLQTAFYANLQGVCNQTAFIEQRFPSQAIAVTPGNAGHLLRHLTDADARRRVYQFANTLAGDNLPVIEALARARLQYGRLLGHPSFAHLRLSTMLGQHPDRIADLLDELTARLAPKAQAEMEVLRHVQVAMGDGRSSSAPGPVAAWDVPYYAEQARRQAGIASSHPERIGLGRVLYVFDAILRNVFGLRIEVHDVVDRGELPHASVRKVVVHECRNGQQQHCPIGTVYLDLYRRPEKLAQAAQFTIRHGAGGSDLQSDLPAVAIVCAFSSGRGLTHGECVQLAHEMGHGLHALLSRTTYSHLAGPRGPTDFAEIPSHLLERFMWDPRIVSMLCGGCSASFRDHVSGQLRARTLFAGLDLQAQVAYAALDQALHGAECTGSPARLWETVHRRHLPYDFVPGTHPFSMLAHLCNYAACYYSYLYSRMMASHVWHEFFASDPMSHVAGRRFRERFLASGCARPPAEILNDLLDGAPQPTIDAFVRNEVECRPSSVHV
ncbi:unnamed protein product (mitochondrion) [Plasmodiophora brassicae]|uniref:Peptidase M3A/M3B catalytic domain-containing protein n=1 Tax=Plasmodiophora brassicae TaxID=37360 RepID=A0A3P3YJ95_PLABS|nr:unnamed protein product [Plasmodiophora brassicae]